VAEVDAAIFRLIVAALPEIHPDLKVFVNTHPQTFGVRELWLDGGVLEPHLARLVIEVTERGVMHEGTALTKMLGELRARGARIALDDLGAGYAALSVVTILRPEVIKLDMSLVRDVDKDEARADLVQALVDLAHRLGATLVAEGVETVGERDTLCALGCDLLQGYLLARPGTIEAIPAPPCPERVRAVFSLPRTAANRPAIGDGRAARWTA
jgi:EAL domain-containing protein (putative c-di-GMP-specific phosphodiesterase class I)